MATQIRWRRRRALALLLGAITAATGIHSQVANADNVIVAAATDVSATGDSIEQISYLRDPYLIDEDSEKLLDATVEAEEVPAAPGTPEAEMSSDSDSSDDSEEEASDESDSDETVTVPKADFDKLMKRFDELEEDWGDYQDELDKKVTDAKKKPTYKANGRVHLDNWNFVDTDSTSRFLENGTADQDVLDRFVFRRIRLELSGTVPNNMIWRTQLDFNRPSAPEMRDVYLGFTNLPHNQSLLIGNQKRPIGLDHLNSSRFNFFAERPFAVEAFNEDARRLGIAMYGVSDDESYNWRYGVFLLENIVGSGRVIENFDQGGLYARVAASPWYDKTSGGRGYLHMALSGSANVTSSDQTQTQARFRTRPNARSTNRWLNTGFIGDATDYQQLGLESILNVGAFQVTGEYLFNTVQRQGVGQDGDDLFFHGGYLYATYYLTGEHISYSRKSGTINRVRPFENFFVVDRLKGGTGRGLGALGIGLRYDYIDLTDSNIAGGVGNSVTLGLNWHWTAYSKLQTNLVWGTVQDGGQDQFNAGNVAPNDGEANYTILGMRYQIDY